MLYIELFSGVSLESEEVAPGIVFDFDENNQVLGIEIEDASTFIDLSKLELSALPIVDLILRKETAVPAWLQNRSLVSELIKRPCH